MTTTEKTTTPSLTDVIPPRASSVLPKAMGGADPEAQESHEFEEDEIDVVDGEDEDVVVEDDVELFVRDGSYAADGGRISAPGPRSVIGRYAIYDEIAAGGMATVCLGRILGPAGFSRIVAIKQMHRHLAKRPKLVAMFLDEVRTTAKIRHPNVVQTLDVIATGNHLLLVMEYVEGESLAQLLRKGGRMPATIVAAIFVQVLHGLHAAHEATDGGRPLEIVHRDISPHNILVGVDGAARLIDFGVAKAIDRLQCTATGEVKGKLGYMAPEQLRNDGLTRATDLYSLSMCMWESLVGKRYRIPHDGQSDVASYILRSTPDRCGSARAYHGDVPELLDQLVMRGLNEEPTARFASALHMALALENAAPRASVVEVSAWVARVACEDLAKRAELIARIERVVSAPALEAAQEFLSRRESEADETVPFPTSSAGNGPSAIRAERGDPLSANVTDSLRPHSTDVFMPFPVTRARFHIALVAAGIAVLLVSGLLVLSRPSLERTTSRAFVTNGGPAPVGGASSDPPVEGEGVHIEPRITVPTTPPASSAVASASSGVRRLVGPPLHPPVQSYPSMRRVEIPKGSADELFPRD